MSPNDERFEMRLSSDLSNRINNWRTKQDDIPSRAEAIRRLIEIALVDTSMKASEKLTISLLCDLYKALKIKDPIDGINPEFIRSAIHGGHYWALSWQYPGLFQNCYDDEETVKEVCDILEMFYRLEGAYKALSQKDKEYVKVNTKMRDDKGVKFQGFDGNNEKHYFIAHFLIKDMGRYPEFQDRADLNSHMEMVSIYQRMLEVFTTIWKKSITGVSRDLNAKEIVEIVKVRVHPENRGLV